MALETWIYPLDPTGTNPDNLVANEPQTLDNRPLRVVALNNGAFYSDTVVITDAATNQPLTSEQWFPSTLYPQPTQQYGLPVYALIVVSDPSVSPNILVTYQVVGGQYSYSQEAAVTQIQNLDLDNQPVSWPNILDTPSEFPPAPHYQNFDTLYGMEYLVNAVYMLANAILVGNAPVVDQVLAYVDQQNTSQNTTTANIQAALSAHVQNTDNPHQTTAAQVGAYTTAEVDANIAAAVAPFTSQITTLTNNLNTHVNNTNNPHDTTVAQLNTYDGPTIDSKIAVAVAAAKLTFTPVQQGGGFSQGTNKVYIGWDGAGLRVQVDSTDMGDVVFQSNLNNVVNNLNASINTKQAAGNYVVQGGNATLAGMSCTSATINGTIAAQEMHSTDNLRVDGTIYCKNDIWAFNSDERFKDRIRVIDNPIERLMKLKGVFHFYSQFGREFNHMNDDREYVGLIAQDVEKALPQAVGLAPVDRDLKTGMSRTGNNYLTAQYERIVPLLVETGKLAFEQLDVVFMELTNLKGQVQSLLAQNQAMAPYGVAA